MLAELPQRASADPVSRTLDTATVSRLVGKGSGYLLRSVPNELLAHAEPALLAIDSIASYELTYAGYQR